MNAGGSGGFGAVSAGIAEPLVLLLIAVALVLLVVGTWKLVKVLWAMFG